MSGCSDQKSLSDAARNAWHQAEKQKCAKEEDRGYNRCTKEEERGQEECTEKREMGYSTCTQQEDQGYSSCCTWIPCSWGCNTLVWFSNLACVAWEFVSNIVCVATKFVSHLVCVATEWVKNIVCVAWAEVGNAAWSAGSSIEWAACEVGNLVGGGFHGDGPTVPDDALPDVSDVVFDEVGPNGEITHRFLWGTATAAYQVEGHRGKQRPHPEDWESDWDIFTTSDSIHDRVRNACVVAGKPEIDLQPPFDADRHHNLGVLKQDLDRAQLLGTNSYRFSIEWSRVQPNAPAAHDRTGGFDDAGLAYYDEVFRALRERDLEPIVTLNHLTLPAWVLTPPKASSLTTLQAVDEDADFRASLRGWESEDTVDAFIKYVEVIVRRYPTVKHWITLNEPVGSMIGLGYVAGIWSPGFSLDGSRATQAYDNLLRAHYRAYHTIKHIAGETAQVGIAHAMMYARVTNMSGWVSVGRGFGVGAVAGAVVGAVVGGIAGGIRGALVGVSWGSAIGGTVGLIQGAGVALGNVNAAARNQFDYFINWHILDALVKGHVDRDTARFKRRAQDQHFRNDAELKVFFRIPEGDDAWHWQSTLDFVGINYYRSVYVYYDQSLALTSAAFVGGGFVNDLHGNEEAHNLLNDFGWEIYPGGLYQLLKSVDTEYKLPIIITENGTAEEVDRNRAPLTIAHLQQVARAKKEGIRVHGYMHWSVLDNFEWHESYHPAARFGLFSVDRSGPEQRRHITEGAFAYQYVIAENKIAKAVQKFGTITPDGAAVIPPVESYGAFYEFQPPNDESGFTIYLSRLADSRLIGMVFYHEWWGDRQRHDLEHHRWIRLRNIHLDAATGQLQFSHPTAEDVSGGELSYTATLSINGLADGTIAPGFLAGNRMPTSWDAPKVLGAGCWQVSEPGFYFALTRAEGDCPFATWTRSPQSDNVQWLGKFFGAPMLNTRAWAYFDSIDLTTSAPFALRPHDTIGDVLLTVDAVSLTKMSGTIRMTGGKVRSQQNWTAQRLPDLV